MNPPCLTPSTRALFDDDQRQRDDTPQAVAEHRAVLLAALEGFHFDYAATRQRQLPVDWVKVQMSIDGDPVELNITERREVIDYLHHRGLSARKIALHVGATSKTVERRIGQLRAQRYKKSAHPHGGDTSPGQSTQPCDDEGYENPSRIEEVA